MKVLLLKECDPANPVFGRLLYTDIHNGSVYPEAILSANENNAPTLFEDSCDNIELINDHYAKDGEKWELIEVGLYRKIYNENILKELEEERIVSFDLDKFSGKLSIKEMCDQWFSVDLTKEKALQLVSELNNLIDQMP